MLAMIHRAWGWLIGGSALLTASAAAARGAGGAAPRSPAVPPTKPPQAPTKPEAPSVTTGPPSSLAGRARWILDAVKAGEAEHSWAPIQLTDGGSLRGKINVSADDLRVGGLRVNADADTTEQAAELLGGMLATSKVADAVWRQAPRTMTPLATKWYEDTTSAGNMASTPRMIEYSAMVDAKLGSNNGLASNSGKWWILARRLWNADARKKAANYGWHRPDGSVIQTVGLAHDRHHTDYSQKLRFMQNVMQVSLDSGKTWQTMKTEDALTSPTLSALLSNEGPLQGGEMP